MSELNERARRQIALLAGDDLEGEQQDEARRYVDSCPDCRGHWLRLRGCLDVLDCAGKTSGPGAETSLWPVIESRLRPTVVMRRSDQFNGWVPALSMAAACIALLIAGQMDGVAPVDFALHGHDDSRQASVIPAGPRLHQPPFRMNSGLMQRFASFERSFALPRQERPLHESSSLGRDERLVPIRSHSSDMRR
ncbi:MAG: hypothetical protein WBC44_03715 [Planctomycetaceae bacterium]